MAGQILNDWIDGVPVVALQRGGYRLLGCAPGYDRKVVAGGEVKRVVEAVYGKVFVNVFAIS